MGNNARIQTYRDFAVEDNLFDYSGIVLLLYVTCLLDFF